MIRWTALILILAACGAAGWVAYAGLSRLGWHWAYAFSGGAMIFGVAASVVVALLGNISRPTKGPQ